MKVKYKFTKKQMDLFRTMGHRAPKDSGGYYYFLPYWVDDDGFIYHLDSPLPKEIKLFIESERTA